MQITSHFLLALASSCIANAHIAAFAPGMFCRNGISGDNFNSNDPIGPLYQLSKRDWWFQHERGCDARPPPPDEYLEIPAGGSFTVQLANNQAFTDLSYDGSMVSQWPDGKDHPEDWHGEWDGTSCLPDGGWMHAQNQSMAQGTAFAISYQSDISSVTMDSLVVFSVLEHTPWHLSAIYEVPSQLEACPEGGCVCAWLWVPQGCGQANMYMQGFKCNVTNVDTTIAKPLAKAAPPVWCQGQESSCTEGAKQMIVFHQLEGDNVEGVPQYESPAYNEKCGFKPGAQKDIFVDQGTSPSSTASGAHQITSSPTSSSVCVSTSVVVVTSTAVVTRTI